MLMFIKTGMVIIFFIPTSDHLLQPVHVCPLHFFTSSSQPLHHLFLIKTNIYAQINVQYFYHFSLPFPLSLILYSPLHLQCIFTFFIPYCYIIKQLLTIETSNKICDIHHRIPILTSAITSVKIGILWWISNHIQYLNSQ